MQTLRKFIGAVSLATMLLTGLPVHAQSQPSSGDYSSYSIEQLQALIAKLQRQVEEMKKGQQCFVTARELSIGDGEGDDMTDDVRRLQNFLIEKGFFAYKSTGYFGKVTRSSLLAFQKKEGIGQSGVLDEATRARMHSMFCKKVVQSNKNYEEEKMKQKEKEKQASGVVNAIKLKSLGGAGVYWMVDGYSKMGFKLVWSKNPTPTYPNRDSDRYQYFESPSQSEGKLEAFNGSGTYYVRVCEYLGGACGMYSNEVQVQL